MTTTPAARLTVLTSTPSAPGAEIKPLDALPAVLADDLKQLHLMLTKVRMMWAQPLDIDEVCKLSLTTLKLLESRRKLMGFPHEMVRDMRSQSANYMTPYE